MFRNILWLSAFLACMVAYIPQGMCLAATADTSTVIAGGPRLLSISPVCYYYDSLCNSNLTERGDWMSIAYVPEKESWTIADFDKEDERTANPIVSVDSNYLELHTGSGSLQSANTQAKLFYDSKGDPFLGVSYIHYGNPHFIYAQFGFYRLSNKGWEDITNTIIKLPDTSAYFGKSINTKLALKYGYIGVDALFSADSDTVELSAFKAFDIHCEDKKVHPTDSDVKMSVADKGVLCSMFTEQTAKGDDFTKKKFLFVYNKASGKFKKINAP